ncbi:hypothetical protein CTI14_59515, partial [Methylobacterium radiotolerans]
MVAAADRAFEETGSGKLALSLAKFYPGGLPELPHALALAGSRPTSPCDEEARRWRTMGLLDGAKTLIGDVVAAADRAFEETGSGKLALSLAKFYPGGLP